MQSIPLFAACKSADVYKVKNKVVPSHDLAGFCPESTTTTFKAQRKRPANPCAPIWILHEPSGYDDSGTQLMAPLSAGQQAKIRGNMPRVGGRVRWIWVLGVVAVLLAGGRVM